jgi:glycerophosphoryl diester phosphodiesterase
MLELEVANTGKVLVLGHRGALGHAPENTMASFELGLELGADLLEMDIHMSHDGELIVMHDAEVSRTTDGHGMIHDLALAEIKKLDAGAWFGDRFRGQRVPTLPEVLAWAKNRIPLVIEIKGSPHPAPGIEEAMVEVLRDHDMLDEVMAISFHHTSVKRVKELEPKLATGILFSGHLVDTVGVAKAALADSVRPKWSYWTAELVEEVHAAGLTAHAWNANDEKRAEYLVGLGIDCIGTNYPERLRAYLDRNGLGWPRT